MIIRLRPRALKGMAAFTITEVVIALGLIGVIAVPALMGCFNSSFFWMRMTRENLRATQLMLERAEVIRLLKWTDVITPGVLPTGFTNYYDETVTNSDGSVDVANAGAVYVGNVYIEDVAWGGAAGAPTYSPDMKQVVVVVTWKTGNFTRVRTNITYVAKDGLQNYVY